MAGRHGHGVRWSRRLVAGLCCLLVSVLSMTTPFTLMLVNRNTDRGVVDGHAALTDRQDKAQLDREYRDAVAYNARLASDGGQVLGEAVDPWSGRSASVTDPVYRSQLDLPADGIMATVEYPRLGISLPVRHGTDDQTLQAGAGHLYGTSLPVGGPDTHAVLSAHSGLADRLMFDRLSLREGRPGDVFYIKVLDRTLAYTVRDIKVIQPDDFSLFKVKPGEDLVSLLTCTPYGVNTQRLVVTGVRTSMPVPAPAPRDAPRDHSGVWILLGLVLVWVLGVGLGVRAVLLRRRA